MWKTRFLCLTSVLKPVITVFEIVLRPGLSSVFPASASRVARRGAVTAVTAREASGNGRSLGGRRRSREIHRRRHPVGGSLSEDQEGLLGGLPGDRPGLARPGVAEVLKPPDHPLDGGPRVLRRAVDGLDPERLV